MNLHIRNITSVRWVVALIMTCVLSALSSSAIAATATSHTFATFTTATITGGDPSVDTALSTGSLPTYDYLAYTVSADFVGGGNPAFSDTITMALTNGASTNHTQPRRADVGAMNNSTNTTLFWRGVMTVPYTGGNNLTISFVDTYTDGSGPYTSELQNVTITIYPAPTPEGSFTPFTTPTITGGGPAVDTSLTVSSLPTIDYLFYTVSADFVGGGNPAFSHTITMALTNGASTNHTQPRRADVGSLVGPASTTLFWRGVMTVPYAGGNNLTISFVDTYTDGSGPYTSELQNVTITIYPAPTPEESFMPFTTPTITGGDPAVDTSLTVSSLPTYDYLSYTVSADFVGGGNPAFSDTITMALTNGASTNHTQPRRADVGAVNGPANTTLFWRGVMTVPYAGGNNLTISFVDTYTDGGGPYTSELQNVTVTIYPAYAADTVRVATDCSALTKPCNTSIAQAVADVATGGTVLVENTVSPENITIFKDVLIQSGTAGVLTGSGGASAINITGGTVTIEQLGINAGTSTNAIVISGGSLLLRGNSIDGDGTAAIVQSGGTATAYANNIVNTGGLGVSGTVSAPKNWWGTAIEANRPTGVSNGDWAVRLGAAAADTAFASGGAVTLGNAQLTGPGPGTGVIINFGSGAGNTPFGVGISPYQDQMCSNFYDFYSTAGTGWTVVLPINTGTAGCTTNTLNPKRAFIINDISECASTTDPACWDPIPANQITIAGNNLEITGLALSGTHIVAGTSGNGSDPTSIALQSITTESAANYNYAIIMLMVGMVLLSGLFFYKKR